MTESEFKDILARYEKGECTPEEMVVIENWLDSHYTDVLPFKDESEKFLIKKQLKESVHRKAGIKNRSTYRRYYLTTVIKVAASILLVVALGFGGFKYYEYKQIKMFEVVELISSERIKKVLLSDGSIIWLKPNSSLKYPKKFKKRAERIVSLTGEALFEIEKDSTRPFLVHSGELTTTVLGTSFNINATSDIIEVVVLTGKVSVTSLSNQKVVVLMPEEKAHFNISSKELARESTPVLEPIRTDIIKGTEYDMKFNDTRLDIIISRIEDKFDIDIELEDETLSGSVVTANFTGQSLVKTLNIISKVLSIEYEIENKKIVFKPRN